MAEATMSERPGKSVQGGRNLMIRPLVHDRLSEIKADMERRNDRVVTFSEVIAMLIDVWAELQP